MGGLERAHHDRVADGQESQVGPVNLADKLHVSEDGGVAGVVELEATLELQDVSHRLAGVDDGSVLFGDAGGVEGVSCGNLDRTDLNRTALLDRLPVLYALVLHVREDLEVSYRRRSGLLGQRDSVGEMVEVAVGDEHGVQLPNLLEFLRRHRVVGQEGVYEDLLVSGRYYPEGRVPEVGDPGPAEHLVHNVPPF